MEVVTTHPVVAATLPWATDAGAHRLTVMVKATFQLRHGEKATLTEPYPFFSDVHHDDNPGCSLSVATDWVPRKRNAEVLFLGSAYAPYGELVPRRTVRLSVATTHGPLVDKSLLVLGERLRNKRTGMTTRPEPFARVPLRYELTFGGAASPHNPVGVGVDAADVRLPAIGYPMDARQVAGLGPLSPTWRPRARLLAGYDPKGLIALVPTLPRDFEYAFFNAAPEDQQVGALSGHEEILLSGLHLTLPEVRTRLPGLRGTAKLAIAGDQRDVALVADTLWISGDTLRACLTFRGDLEVTREIAEGIVPVSLTAGLVAADPPGASKAPTRPSVPGPRLENPMAASVVRGGPVRPQAAPSPAPPTLAIAANAQLPPAPSVALKSTQRGPAVEGVDEMVRPHPVPSAFKSTQRLLPSSDPRVAAPSALAAPIVAPPRIADAQPKASFTTTVDDSSVLPYAFSATPDAPPMAPLATPGPSLFKMTVAAPSSRPWLSSVGEVQPAEEVAAQRPIEAFRRSAPGLAGFVPAAQLEPPGPLPKPPPAFSADEQTESQRNAMPLSEERIFDEAAFDGKFAPPARQGDPLPLVNSTRFVAFSFPWQLRPPQDARVIVVKMTCDLVPNAPATLSEEQLLPSGDLHHDDDENASLRYASDFVPFKPKADVMLVGTMRPGAEGNVGVVTFSVGPLQKKLAVFGARLWGSFGASKPEKFDGIPMRWEHALGGALSPDNPLGIGFKTGIAAPHLEDPDELLRGPATVVPPACFAPVHASWRPRASKVGTYGKKWLETRWPYLPDDFDWAYFNAAAPPLQIAYPEGDERWTIGGFGGPPLGGRLPAQRPRAFVLRTAEAGGDLVEVLLRLDTLWFDADAKKVVLVYRGLVETVDDVASDVSLMFLTRDRDPQKPLTLETARARLHGELAARELLPAGADVAVEPENEVTKLSLSEVYAKMGAKLDEAASERRAPPRPAKPDFKQRLSVPAATMKATMAEVAPPVFLGAVTQVAPAVAPALLAHAPVVAPTPVEVPAASILAEVKAGGSLANRDLTGIDLTGADLSGVDLSKTILTKAKLRSAKLDGAKLTSATLTDVDAEDASFATADLSAADFSRARLDRANLSGAKLQDAVFDGAQGHGARFAACTGERASFVGASLVSATFEGASLPSADFTGATLEAAKLTAAELPDLRLLDAHGMDVVFDQARMQKARVSGAKLPRASFRGIQADDSVWEKVELESANFEGASLHGALFVRAVLDNAIFSRAEAIDGCFRRASLRYAKLLKTNLMRATFEAADLTGADLRGANLYQAETWKAKLTHARTELAIVAGSKLDA